MRVIFSFAFEQLPLHGTAAAMADKRQCPCAIDCAADHARYWKLYGFPSFKEDEVRQKFAAHLMGSIFHRLSMDEADAVLQDFDVLAFSCIRADSPRDECQHDIRKRVAMQMRSESLKKARTALTEASRVCQTAGNVFAASATAMQDTLETIHKNCIRLARKMIRKLWCCVAVVVGRCSRARGTTMFVSLAQYMFAFTP